VLGFKFQLLPLIGSFQFIASQSAFNITQCTETGNEGFDRLWQLWEKTINKERKKEQTKGRKKKKEKRRNFALLGIIQYNTIIQ